MDLELTKEKKDIQMAAREFAKNELIPIADELDQAEEFAWNNFRSPRPAPPLPIS